MLEAVDAAYKQKYKCFKNVFRESKREHHHKQTHNIT